MLSLNTRAYLSLIEESVGGLLRGKKHIMDYLVGDRHDYFEVGRNSTGTTRGWTGHIYEFLTRAFIKKGLSKYVTRWKSPRKCLGGREISGRLRGSEGTLSLLLNPRFEVKKGRTKRPDIVLMLNEEPIAVFEVKSSLSNERKRVEKSLKELSNFKFFDHHPECLAVLVFYGDSWTEGPIDGYDLPSNFMFVSTTKLRGSSRDLSRNFEGRIYDIRDVIQKIESDHLF